MQQAFIIIKGKPCALQIESMVLQDNGTYVKYYNNPKWYCYNKSNVLTIKDAISYTPKQYSVWVNGIYQHNIKEILSFPQGQQTHWRITYTNGNKQDFFNGVGLEIEENYLTNKDVSNVFEYVKSVARANSLGRTDESQGILANQYDKIDTIGKSLSVVPYLFPQKVATTPQTTSHLVYPFGCNASQKKAVIEAFKNQLSVIQGPPGTGKTQTILNIIANIVMKGKTVMVVSNNNSATANVYEKLQKYGIDFIVATLGSRENKEAFVRNLPNIPEKVSSWRLDASELNRISNRNKEIVRQLDTIFTKQEKLAHLRLELQSLQLEQKHFLQKNVIELIDNPSKTVRSTTLMSWWIRCQAIVDKNLQTSTNFIDRLFGKLSYWWIRRRLRNFVKTKDIDNHNVLLLITLLQGLYYQSRIRELLDEISNTEHLLTAINAKKLIDNLTDSSMRLLKDTIAKKYKNMIDLRLSGSIDINSQKDIFCSRFPVILSTTFSARSSIPRQIYDYIIIDEASQVSIETGVLALTCAKNAVIVGDTKQLPHVVTEENKKILNNIFNSFQVNQGYNCANYSFLESVCKIIPNITQTLLREHYRCHPRIINFCNQKYYGGNLLIMTEDNEEDDVLSVTKCIPGHHARNHFNQREIDVIKQEVLPNIKDADEIGIVSPYNAQVDAINTQLGDNIAATVHKYQGREKDCIIFSVVDDVITTFSDDANLLNVAISRAKKNFHLVVSGNEQTRKGNISDLIDYIEYNNCRVSDSKVYSIFDYLYGAYNEQRRQLLFHSKRISEYDSENLTYTLIEKILNEHNDYHCFGVLCHYPLRILLSDTSALTEEECRYANQPGTHLDFLIYSLVSKKPVLAIETDGYTFHNKQTKQYQRDMLKNSILNKYDIPLLRLSTTGSGEEQHIIAALESYCNRHIATTVS